MATPRKKNPRFLPATHQADALPLECPWLEPGAGGENLEIQDFPTFLILRLANLTKSHLTRRYLDPFGISLPEWRLLALMARYGTLPFSDVTAGSSMDKGQVSRTLQSIHRKELVKLTSVTAAARAPGSAMSPRMEVSISPKGRALFQKILPIARAHQLQLLDVLNAEERKVFHAVARRLLTQFSATADEA